MTDHSQEDLESIKRLLILLLLKLGATSDEIRTGPGYARWCCSKDHPDDQGQKD